MTKAQNSNLWYVKPAFYLSKTAFCFENVIFLCILDFPNFNLRLCYLFTVPVFGTTRTLICILIILK